MSDLFEVGDVVEDERSVIGTIAAINPESEFSYTIRESEGGTAHHKRTPNWRKVPMNNATNRLAQIIGHAADKYRGLAGMRPTEQDKAAAQAIEAEYLFIRRDELPKTAILHKPDGAHLEVSGAEIGTWPLRHPKNTVTQQRKYALEYLAAAEAIQEWRDDAVTRRRDELAAELGCPGLYPTLINTAPMKLAIDRIIELEGKAA